MVKKIFDRACRHSACISSYCYYTACAICFRSALYVAAVVLALFAGLRAADQIGLGSSSGAQIVFAADYSGGGGSSGGAGADTDSSGNVGVTKNNFNILWNYVFNVLGPEVESLRKADTATGKSISAIHKQIDALWAADAASGKSITAIHEQIDRLWAADTATGKSITAIHEDISRLWAADSSTGKSISAIHKDIDALLAADAATGQSITAIHKQIDDLWSADTKTGKSITAIHADLDELEANYKTQAAKASDLAKTVDLLSKSDSLQSADIASLTSQLAALQLSNNSLSDSLSDIVSRLNQAGSSALDTTMIVHAVDVVRDYIADLQKQLLMEFGDLPLAILGAIDKSTILNKIYVELVQFHSVFSTFSVRDFLSSLVPALQPIYDNQTAVIKQIKDVLDALGNPSAGSSSNPSGGPGGTNFWDVLSSLAEQLSKVFGALSDLAKSLIDLLVKVFVPNDASFVTDSFSGFSEKFKTKFSVVFSLPNSIKSVFGGSKKLRDFPLSVSGTTVIVPVHYVSALAAIVRPWLSGALVLLTIIGIYRRFADGEVVS